MLFAKFNPHSTVTLLALNEHPTLCTQQSILITYVHFGPDIGNPPHIRGRGGHIYRNCKIGLSVSWDYAARFFKCPTRTIVNDKCRIYIGNNGNGQPPHCECVKISLYFVWSIDGDGEIK